MKAPALLMSVSVAIWLLLVVLTLMFGRGVSPLRMWRTTGWAVLIVVVLSAAALFAPVPAGVRWAVVVLDIIVIMGGFTYDVARLSGERARGRRPGTG